MADELEDAMKDLWKSFLAAPDYTYLALFCQNYADKRMPESFLENFTTKLKKETESGSWTLKEDPGYEFPKDLMTRLMKKLKKLAEDGKKEEVSEEEIEDEKNEQVTEEEVTDFLEKKLAEDEKKEQVAEEDNLQEEELDELVQEEELELEHPLTEAELEQNRKAFREKLENAKKARILSGENKGIQRSALQRTRASNEVLK